LTRDNARKYRDSRLRSGVRPSRISRKINIIRAVINKAVREIPLTMPNHFESEERIRYSWDETRTFIIAALKKNDGCRMIIIVFGAHWSKAG
jgi:hypothetical protein